MPEESESHPLPPKATSPSFLTETRFDEFNPPEKVLKGLGDAGFTHCTPIQAQVLPISLEGRDVAGQAQTGTGKTAAFLVTMFSRLLAEKDREPGAPAALIVAPTRELAFQIHEEAQVIGGHTGLTMVRVVGGIDYQKQADVLKKGVDIVICTPGRLIDYYKQGVFKTKGIKIVVIDEADRLLDLGFAKDMRFILSKLPNYKERQSMLFSATLSYRVMELTYEYMNLPEFVAVAPEEVTVEGIEQTLFHVGLEKKLPLLLGLLEREDWTRMLIFVNTKVGVDWLNKKLKGNKHPSEGITGDLPQPKRFKLMERFKNGSIKILIATDVASRGIHVEDISHVINYDLPQDAENYIHRIGRTARAGKTGRALSLACERYVFHLEPLENMLGYKIPVVWPEDDWLLEDKAGPVVMERKARRAKTSRDKARTRRRNRPASRKTPAKTKSTFPGAFFGFGPPPETPKEPANETPEAPSAKAKAKAKPTPKPKPKARQNDKDDPPKKKKRRRRWKKKSGQKEKPAADAAGVKQADDVKEQPDVDAAEKKPADDVKEQPDVDAAEKKPADDVKEQPDADAAEKKTADDDKKQPTADAAGGKTDVGVSKDKKTTDAAKGKPAVDDAKEQPADDAANEKPDVAVADEKPTPGSAKEKPAVKNTGKKPVRRAARKKTDVEDAEKKPRRRAARKKTDVEDAEKKPRRRAARKKPDVEDAGKKPRRRAPRKKTDVEDAGEKPAGVVTEEKPSPSNAGKKEKPDDDGENPSTGAAVEESS